MRIWILGFLTVLTFLSVSCKDKAPQVEHSADTTLPAQPPLEPLAEDIQEPDPSPQSAPIDHPSLPAHPGQGLTPNGPYTLQIALFSEEHKATRMAKSLKALGIPAYVSWVLDPTPQLSGTYYRVRAGAFATTRAARAYGQANISPLNRDFWVDLKGRDSQPVHQVFKPHTSTPPAPPKTTPPPAPQTTPVIPAAPAAPVAIEPTPAVTPPPAPEASLPDTILPKTVEEEKPEVMDTPTVQDW